jgi:hypothetical protein
MADRGITRTISDMLRAFFVAAHALLALMLVAFTVATLAAASSSRGPILDTVMPTLGFDDAALLAGATIVAVVALVDGVRFYMRGSWHVVTAAIMAALSTIPFGWASYLLNSP